MIDGKSAYRKLAETGISGMKLWKIVDRATVVVIAAAQMLYCGFAVLYLFVGLAREQNFSRGPGLSMLLIAEVVGLFSAAFLFSCVPVSRLIAAGWQLVIAALFWSKTDTSLVLSMLSASAYLTIVATVQIRHKKSFLRR